MGSDEVKVRFGVEREPGEFQLQWGQRRAPKRKCGSRRDLGCKSLFPRQ